MQGLKIFTIVHTYMTSIGAIFASISEVGEVEYIFHIFFFGRGISKNWIYLLTMCVGIFFGGEGVGRGNNKWFEVCVMM